MKRIVSGIQPSGGSGCHLGNYLGAIRNWVKIQDEGECFFFLADLHALSQPISQVDLHRNVRSMAAMLLACGIDSERSSLFIQSHVPEHTSLNWILTCAARMGWLNRMTQFKDKGGNDAEAAFHAGWEACLDVTGDGVNLPFGSSEDAWDAYDRNRPSVGVGLFAYPILQAADVLLYDATHVPVGDDQDQHLQLVRDIAQSFNSQYGVEILTSPKAVREGTATRVMSLKNGSKKMSKSDPDDMTRINLTDTDDEIVRKIKRATTDSDFLPETSDTNCSNLQDRPEALNLLNILAALRDTDVPAVLEQDVGGKGFGNLKSILSEELVSAIGPIRDRYYAYRGDERALLETLQKGRYRASNLARSKMAEISQVVFGY